MFLLYDTRKEFKDLFLDTLKILKILIITRIAIFFYFMILERILKTYF
jgi:hypothetical protein